jgi:hypothetical protein
MALTSPADALRPPLWQPMHHEPFTGSGTPGRRRGRQWAGREPGQPTGARASALDGVEKRVGRRHALLGPLGQAITVGLNPSHPGRSIIDGGRPSTRSTSTDLPSRGPSSRSACTRASIGRPVSQHRLPRPRSHAPPGTPRHAAPCPTTPGSSATRGRRSAHRAGSRSTTSPAPARLHLAGGVGVVVVGAGSGLSHIAQSAS